MRKITFGDSQRAAMLARESRGSGGNIFVSHAARRDILRILEALEELRDQG